MRTVLLGHDVKTGEAIRIPHQAFATHFHLIGGTGKGKTTALHTLLHPLLTSPVDEACFLIVDRLGNFSEELLLWMASDFCTEDVRERLLYIEPSREDVVLGFNPLIYDTEAHGYYKVARATDVVLRAWESVNIEAMPRLARWTFNAFWAAAQLGLTIADCVHFLMPGSPHHEPLMACLPSRLRYEWEELIGSRSAEVLRTLESSRNRLKPYFESDILRRMFGATTNRLDVERFMREKKIVVLNLAPRNRLSEQLGNAIGALVINEVLATARSLPRGVRYPTYLVLDEFQNFVGPDIEAALPEVRQLGLRLLLSHQSLSQLTRGDYDLSSMIFQSQSRVIFGVQGEDADVLAHELASITFDPLRIKDELYSRRQLTTGHRVVELQSWSNSQSLAEQWNRSYGSNTGERTSVTRRDGSSADVRTQGSDRSSSASEGQGGSRSHGSTVGAHQSLIPEYDEFLELSSRTYSTFDEQRNEWAKAVRNLATGRALVRLVNDPRILEVQVKRSAPGHLNWDTERLVREFPDAFEAADELVAKNFQSDWFSAPETIDRETEARLAAVLRPKLTVRGESSAPRDSEPNDDSPQEEVPFW